MRLASDVAASQGKLLQQFVEAIVDLAAGQNDRLIALGNLIHQISDDGAVSFWV